MSWRSLTRRPGPGLIWHSDQGSQFVSLAFGQQAHAAGIAQSMGSRGDCYDNAVAESFFATLKKELVHGRSWPSKADLRSEVFEYIEVFYNRRRRHSTLGYLAPAQFETITHHHQLQGAGAERYVGAFDCDELGDPMPGVNCEPQPYAPAPALAAV